MEILTSLKRLYIRFKSFVNDFVYSFGRAALLLLVEVQNHTVPVRERRRIRVKACTYVLPKTFIQTFNFSQKFQRGSEPPALVDEPTLFWDFSLTLSWKGLCGSVSFYTSVGGKTNSWFLQDNRYDPWQYFPTYFPWDLVSAK